MNRKESLEKLRKRNEKMYSNVLKEITNTSKEANTVLRKTTNKSLESVKKISQYYLNEINKKIEKEEAIRKRIKKLVERVNQLFKKLENTNSLEKLKELKLEISKEFNKKAEQIKKFKGDQEKIYEEEFGKINKNAKKIFKPHEN